MVEVLATKKEGAPLLKKLAQKGRGRDNRVARLTPEQMRLLYLLGGSGKINPLTGLPEFDDGEGGGDAAAEAGASVGDAVGGAGPGAGPAGQGGPGTSSTSSTGETDPGTTSLGLTLGPTDPIGVLGLAPDPGYIGTAPAPGVTSTVTSGITDTPEALGLIGPSPPASYASAPESTGLLGMLGLTPEAAAGKGLSLGLSALGVPAGFAGGLGLLGQGLLGQNPSNAQGGAAMGGLAGMALGPAGSALGGLAGYALGSVADALGIQGISQAEANAQSVESAANAGLGDSGMQISAPSGAKLIASPGKGLSASTSFGGGLGANTSSSSPLTDVYNRPSSISGNLIPYYLSSIGAR